MNDYHVNKNSTVPILSPLPIYHYAPLHIGFLKIWFIFKLETFFLLQKRRKGNHEDMCMTAYESWVHTQAERRSSWGFFVTWLALSSIEKAIPHLKGQKDERERLLNLEYSSWKYLTQTLKSWNIPNQPQFRTQISLMRLLDPETPCFLSPKRHDT